MPKSTRKTATYVWEPGGPSSVTGWRDTCTITYDDSSGEGPPGIPPWVPGIDVSHYQEAIDWKAVGAAGLSFVYIKASDGYCADPYFVNNWKQAKEQQLLRGAYHYFRPNLSPQQQAEIFNRLLGPLSTSDLAPALDLEEAKWPASVQKRISLVHECLDEIENLTGRRPILYTRAKFANSMVKGLKPFVGYGVWIADRTQCYPRLPTAFDDRGFVLYECTATGKVPGIKPLCDLDYADVSELRRMAGCAPRPATETPKSVATS